MSEKFFAHFSYLLSWKKTIQTSLFYVTNRNGAPGFGQNSTRLFTDR
jgi:hypothetical protein